MPIIGMAVDLVAPSLPAIAADLHIRDETAKNIITTYLLGYALGNFFTGFLTDAFGRQFLMRFNLAGFVMASLLPTIIPQIEVLLIARLLQGLSIGASAVLLRSILSDILPREQLVKMGTILGTMWGLGPVFGPVIGGYLQYYLGWKACFYFFAIVSSLGFFATWWLIPETIAQRQALNFANIKRNSLEVLTNRTFIALPILMGVAYAMIIVFHTGGPFLIQNILHYSPVFFGHLALCLGTSFLIATLVAKYLVSTTPLNKIYLLTITIAGIIAVIGVGFSYLLHNNITLITIISLIMFFSTGILFPMSMGRGLAMFSHIAGTATAIMYLINGVIVSLTAYLMSFITIQDSNILMWSYLILLLICALVYVALIHQQGRTSDHAK